MFLMCRACYGVLRFVMESGAKGCEVIVTGKLRAARAKAMKFKDGYMISSGHPTTEFIDSAVRHVLLRQGCLGIKVCFIPLSDWAGACPLEARLLRLGGAKSQPSHINISCCVSKVRVACVYLEFPVCVRVCMTHFRCLLVCWADLVPLPKRHPDCCIWK